MSPSSFACLATPLKTLDPAQLSLFLVSESKKNELLALSLSDAQRVALSSRLKKFGNVQTGFVPLLSSEEIPTFYLPFTEGGALAAFLYPEKGQSSTFQIHCNLRQLWEKIKKNYQGSRFEVDLTLLSLEQQGPGLSALLSLDALSEWKPESFAKKILEKSEVAVRHFEVHTGLDVTTFEACVLENQALAIGTNFVRTLADLPPNKLDPHQYVERLRGWAKTEDLEFEFLNREKLKELGAGAFLAVNQADPNSNAGIAILRSRPKNKAKFKVALVGKGVCFDTGGYNIKVQGMTHMNRDMTGSAIAAGLTQVWHKVQNSARRGVPVDGQISEVAVEAYLAISENLISTSAYRPSEVVTALNGTSIEVIDTDAEGRMVLADALALASRAKPDLILDFATLTGACFRALDTRRSGVFSRPEKLNELAVRVGDACGERVWPFPLGGDYDRELKSAVADLKQCTEGKNADHIYAASFLAHFVDPSISWVHMDLSASTNAGGLGLVSSDTTGFGLRWGYEFIRAYLGSS